MNIGNYRNFKYEYVILIKLNVKVLLYVETVAYIEGRTPLPTEIVPIGGRTLDLAGRRAIGMCKSMHEATWWWAWYQL